MSETIVVEFTTRATDAVITEVAAAGVKETLKTLGSKVAAMAALPVAAILATPLTTGIAIGVAGTAVAYTGYRYGVPAARRLARHTRARVAAWRSAPGTEKGSIIDGDAVEIPTH